MANTLEPTRTIADLTELGALTGNDGGAQRVAFTPVWTAARRWLREKLARLPVEVHQDAGGNIWATLAGRSPRVVIVGSHLDSVPNGGWLDGCLGVLAGLEVLRRLAAGGRPPVTVRLVDWCDEEGARFGRSLFGSSAASGSLVPADVADLTDADGHRLADVVATHGIDLARATEARRELDDAAAYLELHIEQGPVLLNLGKPMGVVLGTVGVERHQVTFTGQAAHSGSTPMADRRDALGGVSRLHLAAREIAVRHGGVATVGRVVTRPGIVTAVAGEAEMTLDMRHLDAAALASMLADAREAGRSIAADERIDIAWRRLWAIQPFPFHPDLIALAGATVADVCGTSHRLPSGPLHDAAEVCRAGVPTVMLFVQSLHGISHSNREDTREEHIALAVRALDGLATATMDWVAAGSGSPGR